MAKSLKELALSRASAFRHTDVTVPEWDGVKVVLGNHQQKHGCTGRT